MSKVGRNDPCPCGSGKKYKQCCLRNAPAAVVKPAISVVAIIQAAIDSHQAGRLADAEAFYRQAIGLLSNKQDLATAHNSLGVVLKGLGKTDEAVRSFNKAISLKPDLFEAHGNLGNLLRAQGKLEEARASFQCAALLKPDLVEAHFNLAAIHSEQGRASEAIPHLQKIISTKPADANIHNLLGNAYLEQGDFDAAANWYRKAIALNPDLSNAHSNLSALYWRQGRFSDALSMARRAVALDSKSAIAHNSLGLVLMALGNLDEAIDVYRQALALNPEFSDAYNNLAVILQQQGKRLDALAHFQKALAIRQNHSEAYSGQLQVLNFIEQAHTLESVALARGWEKSCVSANQRKLARDRIFRRDSRGARRLKIGYVSPDFRRHAVAYFIEPVFASHDKNRFEVFCYYNHHQRDAITDRLIEYSDHWINCFGVPDQNLVERICADEIDILIDLAGHTEGNRLRTFAMRPAPIQITYLGYPGTSGLTSMDYRLTDSLANPSGSDLYYTERLLRMPDSLWCYRPSDEMPNVNALPAQENGHITFGSLNNSNKIDSACVKLWARLLLEMPHARLLMVTVPEGGRRQEIIEEFNNHRVGVERLEFHGKLATDEFLRMFHRVDVALDPVFVNGATTTCESLWMGVPTLSLVGNRFLSRAGLSILSAAGVKEFAANNEEDFLRIAKELTGDFSRLANLRAGLRGKVARSPLTDAARFTKNLERQYLQVWDQWCANHGADGHANSH